MWHFGHLFKSLSKNAPIDIFREKTHLKQFLSKNRFFGPPIPKGASQNNLRKQISSFFKKVLELPDSCPGSIIFCLSPKKIDRRVTPLAEHL